MSRPVDKIIDELLILKIQSGETEAFKNLASRWQVQLSKFANLICQDQDMAREAVQEAWIAIIKHLMTLKDPSVFHSWALRITYRKCIDLLRRETQSKVSRVDSSDHLELLASDDTSFKQLEDQDEIRAILSSLNEHHRTVLALHFLQDFSLKEIAGFLQIPEGTVKSRIHHAKQAFRLSKTSNYLNADTTQSKC